MPKKRKAVFTYYECTICNREYDLLREATTCEKRGVAVPEFAVSEVAYDTRRDILVVIAASLFTTQNFHELPGGYGVALLNKNRNLVYGYSPHNTLLEVDSLDEHCPLCGSDSISGATRRRYSFYSERIYSGRNKEISKPPAFETFLRNVHITRCCNCSMGFFTRTQRKDVTLRFKAMLKDKKINIGDTKMLIRMEFFD